MKTNLKIAYINPNPQPVIKKVESNLNLIASNHLKQAQTQLNLFIKDIAKLGLMENDVIVARINAIKQNLYVAQDCVKEAV